MRIEACFLTGMLSTETIVHALRVHNTIDRSIDEVFISDYAFKTVCQSDDQEVARLWAAFKESESSGYTDEGFLDTLDREMTLKGYTLWKSQLVDGLTLTATLDRKIMDDQTLVWRINKPIVKRKLAIISERSKRVGWLELTNPSWHENGCVIGGTFDKSFRIVNYAKNVLGLNNPFEEIIYSGTIPGYEMLRRLLL